MLNHSNLNYFIIYDFKIATFLMKTIDKPLFISFYTGLVNLLRVNAH